MEIEFKDTSGKYWHREIEEGKPFDLYGDEVEITIPIEDVWADEIE